MFVVIGLEQHRPIVLKRNFVGCVNVVHDVVIMTSGVVWQLLHTQGPHYTKIMKPPLKLPLNMAADSLR